MELWLSKALSMSLLGLVSLLCGVAPLFLRGRLSRGGRATDLVISALACFGGGVVLTTCVTHMLPEVNIMLANNVANGEIPKTGLLPFF